MSALKRCSIRLHVREQVRGGDVLDIELPEAPPMQAGPEDIPLEARQAST